MVKINMEDFIASYLLYYQSDLDKNKLNELIALFKQYHSSEIVENPIKEYKGYIECDEGTYRFCPNITLNSIRCDVYTSMPVRLGEQIAMTQKDEVKEFFENQYQTCELKEHKVLSKYFCFNKSSHIA